VGGGKELRHGCLEELIEKQKPLRQEPKTGNTKPETLNPKKQKTSKLKYSKNSVSKDIRTGFSYPDRVKGESGLRNQADTITSIPRRKKITCLIYTLIPVLLP
jgi:hypothetical protein